MEKKIKFVIFLFVFITFSLIFNTVVKGVVGAEEGGDCNTQGGLCLSSCEADQSFIGVQDCASGLKCCLQNTIDRTERCQTSEDADTGEPTGINTAIGCIGFTSLIGEGIISRIFTWAIGIAGGIAFILIVVASFQIMTSRGNPEKLKVGQELLIAAISGLLMLLFSGFILRIIGVEILGIF